MKKLPVYIVTGFMRCGTSVMMQALDKGGLHAIYRNERDEMVRRNEDKDYSPNAGGLWELLGSDYQDKRFPESYRGWLVKALNAGGINRLVPGNGGAKVVFCYRHPEEIRQSWAGFFALTKKGPPANMDATMIERRLNRTLRILKASPEVRYSLAYYPHVLADPEKELTRIKEELELPIDPAVAASVYDPEQRHYGPENIEVGA